MPVRRPLMTHGDAPLEPWADEALDSWEMADLEESMNKLLAPLSSRQEINHDEGSTKAIADVLPAADAFESVESGEVDSFLCEALQGEDRLTILRFEQEVDKFMRNPKLLELEFPPMPSSYLRLAAHRVVQHYNLQSSVVDCNIPEGARIIARKTAQSVLPRIKLSDIRVDADQEERFLPTGQQKFELIRRPPKGSRASRDNGDLATKPNTFKSVEERKEEYNKARARIFCSSESPGKDEEDYLRSHETVEVPVITRFLDKRIEQSNDRSDGFTRSNSSVKQHSRNRVAIFRDREKDRKDPDYDRSYDRYMHRYDPGFGISEGLYGMQPVYTPTVNYNTEFPQLSGSTRPPVSAMHRAPQVVRNTWRGAANGLVYGHVDPMGASFNPGHISSHPGSGFFVHPSQLTCASPSVTYDHQPPLSIPRPQLKQDGNFIQARRQ